MGLRMDRREPNDNNNKNIFRAEPEPEENGENKLNWEIDTNWQNNVRLMRASVLIVWSQWGKK